MQTLNSVRNSTWNTAPVGKEYQYCIVEKSEYTKLLFRQCWQQPPPLLSPTQHRRRKHPTICQLRDCRKEVTTKRNDHFNITNKRYCHLCVGEKSNPVKTAEPEFDRPYLIWRERVKSKFKTTGLTCCFASGTRFTRALHESPLGKLFHCILVCVVDTIIVSIHVYMPKPSVSIRYNIRTLGNNNGALIEHLGARYYHFFSLEMNTRFRRGSLPSNIAAGLLCLQFHKLYVN